MLIKLSHSVWVWSLQHCSSYRKWCSSTSNTVMNWVVAWIGEVWSGSWPDAIIMLAEFLMLYKIYTHNRLVRKGCQTFFLSLWKWLLLIRDGVIWWHRTSFYMVWFDPVEGSFHMPSIDLSWGTYTYWPCCTQGSQFQILTWSTKLLHGPYFRFTEESRFWGLDMNSICCLTHGYPSMQELESRVTHWAGGLVSDWLIVWYLY